MAAPPTKTLQNLGGTWTLNRALSDDVTPALKLQGMSFFLRTAATWATVHMKVIQPDQDHISCRHFATALKIPGTEEDYVLDWEWKKTKDPVYGMLDYRSRWITWEEGKAEGCEEGGVEWVPGESDGMMVQTQAKKPEGSWGSENFWGFAVIDGQRRFVKWARLWKEDGGKCSLKAVYDWNEE